MFKKWILLLLVWLPLTGCIPAALVIGASVGGAVLYEKRSFKQMNKDNRATVRSTTKIRRDRSLNGQAHVKVSVFNGIALIVGEAANAEIKKNIGQKVASTPSVRRVYNEIKIEGSAGTLSRVNDVWLSSKVRTAMLLKRGLRATNISIVTEAGNIYLMGLVTQKQGALAASVASNVSGVKRVVKVFEYE